MRNLKYFGLFAAALLMLSGSFAEAKSGFSSGHSSSSSFSSHSSSFSSHSPASAPSAPRSYAGFSSKTGAAVAVGAASGYAATHAAVSESGKQLSAAQQSNQSANVLAAQRAETGATKISTPSAEPSRTQQPAMQSVQSPMQPQTVVVHDSGSSMLTNLLLFDAITHHDAPRESRSSGNVGNVENGAPASPSGGGSAFWLWLILIGIFGFVAYMIWRKLDRAGKSARAVPRYSID